MSLEGGILSQSEKERKKLSEKELKNNIKKTARHKKIKEKISVEIETEDKIFDLKELVERGVLSKETAEKVQMGSDIDEVTINEIFEKIDEIEDVKNIDNYLPKDLRITHDEYFKALHDDIFRVQMLTKINSALSLLSRQVNPDSTMGLNLFSGFLTVLDKNLIRVQEHNIDVKENLEEVDKVKFGEKEDNRTLWQKFCDFIKEIVR